MATRRHDLTVQDRIHRPEDLERTLAGATGRPCRVLQPISGGGLLLAAEIDRDLPQAWLAELVGRMRAAVAGEHEVVAETVALVAPGQLGPDTGDGPGRSALLNRYRHGEIEVLHVDSLSPAPLPATGEWAGQAPGRSGDPGGRPAAADAGPGGDPGGRSAEAGPLTLEAVRQAAAAMLGMEPADLGDEDDLVRCGLDSIRTMQLAGEWQRRGVEVKFADLFDRPTLAAWWELLSARPQRERPARETAPEVDQSAPFGLTPVQYAYWIGRQDRQVLGGVGCHFYVEFDGAGVDVPRLEDAVHALFRRHALLRTRFLDDGTQQILDRSPWPGLTVHDLRGQPAETAAERLAALRDELSHRRLEVERGEVFDLRLSLLPGGAYRLHTGFDLLVADVRSIQIILEDLAALYSRPDDPLPELTYGFPTYLAEQEVRRREARRADREYWQERIADLPGGPQLPLAVEPERIGRVRVVRRDHWMPPERRRRLADRAREHGLTLPMVLATALAEVLGAWSGRPRFLLNLPLFDRQTLHPDVPMMVADFTNLLLLQVDLSEEMSFAERARTLQSRFQADVAHSAYSGVEVLRDLNRGRSAGQVSAPVVFTSAVGMGDLVGAEVQKSLGDLGWMLSQTPQVWLDHQVVEVDGGLLFNWDAVEELFPAGVLDAMAAAFAGLLARLAEEEWDGPVPDLLPHGQRAVRGQVNDTGGPVPPGLLHSGFFALAEREPGRVALAGDGVELSYGELAGRALRVAGALRSRGVEPGDAVTVSLPKGADQVVAVLGVLAAGGVYVPVGVDQPPARRDRIAALSRAVTSVEDVAALCGGVPLAGPVGVDAGAPAYVIFTSGSTGEPKGVEVSHRAALNTVVDVNARFGVGPGDRVLALSALDFDLSVWDVFGLLSAGGALVLITEDERRDAARWVEAVAAHGVTVWNTVPALLDMLLVAGETAPGALDGLRLAMVSGDWVGLDLPARLADQAGGCRLVALGGATEAAIWSNFTDVPVPVPAHWTSVPYGRPLTNQRFRVVDGRGRDCPDWVPGELWIGGTGVALGYRGDPEVTAAKFVERDGGRWYRTGDLGRYWPDGTLEFLGRADHQVKVGGHRIELGEIESALAAHPDVGHAVVTTVGGKARRLAALVTAPGGTAPRGLREWLAERLPPYMVPEWFAALPDLPLSANGKVDRGAVRNILEGRLAGRTERSVPPVGPVETAVAEIWSELLGLPAVGRDQNFFTLGGDSLLATRLMTRLRTAGIGGAELSRLFETPVLADFAATLELGAAALAQRTLTPDIEHRHDPFPPTDVQRAYWIGRTDDFALGGVGCHFYTEYDVTGMDLARLEEAWNLLIGRHEMLRAEFLPDGRQRILPEVPRFSIPVTDVPGADDGTADRALADLRDAMSHQLIDATRWPLFDVRAVRYGGDRTRIGISFDNIILDALSTMNVLRELETLYTDPGAELPPVGMSFRDYVLGVQPDPAALEKARKYWSGRVSELPPAPQLPLAADPSQIGRPRFVRRQARLSPEKWQAVKESARRHALTPSTVLATAFAEVLGAWSARQDLTINLTLFDRREVHPDIDKVLGDFTSLLLVAYEPVAGESWLDGARRMQQQVVRDLEHSDASAIWVMRELARSTGSAEVSMPVVFTSTLGVTGDDPWNAGARLFAEPVWGVSQTPQVWLDHQVIEAEGGLLFNWDAVEELFPAGMLDAMFGAFAEMLEWLAGDDWDAAAPCPVPAGQLVVRSEANGTAGPVPEGNLHSGFFALAEREPGRVALAGDGVELSYGELAGRALRVAGALRSRGVEPGDAVAVTVPRGADQIVAVLGVLAAGATYVPVGVDQPPVRRDRIYRRAGVRLVLTGEPDVSPDSSPDGGSNGSPNGSPGGSTNGSSDVSPDGVERVPVTEAGGVPLAGPVGVDAGAPAYVIFTSGSTGEPKGVEVSHRAALNTVVDVNARFGVGSGDRVLALSALDFDLSVWDVFGLLSAGGALVLVEEEARREARRWAELMAAHGVTVWNTVPALLDMLLVAVPEELPPGLRLAMVSGDWVGLDLPGRLAAAAPGCRLVALGGATEAAIWSNAFEVAEVDPRWRSIPYGFPLRNQCYRVVDGRGRDCPDWVPGELWIGGAGVALGYRGDPEVTAAKFVERDGGRWYRTGDLGRYWPDGTLEFLGRADHQVKVRGHRIELGEVESALHAHPDVDHAVVTTVGHPTRRLAALVVAAAGTGPQELRDWLAERLPPYAVPPTITMLDRFPLSANGKVDRGALAKLAERDGQGTDEDAPPSGPVEEALGRIWCELLGLDRVGRHQSFVALGGDSILAARLAEEIRIGFGADLALREIFAGPTVAEHAALIEQLRTETETAAFEEGVV
ncbi:amino acid adenylation domain-containing protein [Streptosporangium canum]|uniref:amino acid adenylation domain-containing protein n=1 Tax=Streptosporangium canum TaxID=324952 RepID=UPI00379D19BD